MIKQMSAGSAAFSLPSTYVLTQPICDIINLVAAPRDDQIVLNTVGKLVSMSIFSIACLRA